VEDRDNLLVFSCKVLSFDDQFEELGGDLVRGFLKEVFAKVKLFVENIVVSDETPVFGILSSFLRRGSWG